MKKYFYVLLTLFTIVTLSWIIRRNLVQYNSTITLKNPHWEKVHIQVRKGYKLDPTDNKLIFDQYLSIGQSCTFTLDNGDDVVYRRDSDPDHPDGKHFTNWVYANGDDSSCCSVDNP